MKRWYKLDNIAKFYASTTLSKVPTIFRYSALLEDPIEESILQVALNRTIKIYQNFNVNLKKGLFWYYLEETNKENKVTIENLPICFKLYNSSDDFLYRVSYYKNKINFEVSHILSDGKGSIGFFKLLLTNYISSKYNLKVKSSKEEASILQKAEDSFDKYYKKTKLPKLKKEKIYIYKGKLNNQTRFLECHLSAREVLKLSHSYNTTLTGLLLAVLIYSFKDKLKVVEKGKTIKIDLPVDLRNYFASSSSRNFFGLTNISYKYDNLEVTLEDIIKEVNNQLKTNLTKEKLSERVNLMVSYEKNWFCRFVPIFIKNLVITIADKLVSNKSTTSLSNLGIIKLDPKIEEKIKSISVLTATSNFLFTVCTLKDDLCIGISSKYVNNDVIKDFCRFFTNNNIKMVVNVNEVD